MTKAIKNRIIEKGMTFHRDDSLMKAIYSAKNTAFKNNDFKPLPDDKWNPGDIWAADSDFSVKEISTTTVEGMNDDILDLYLQKRLVGVSLKKVAKGAQGVEKNVERPAETEDYKYSAGHIKALKRGEWYTTKANYITHQAGQLDIRDNNAFGTHKVEIKGKGARGGGASWGVLSDAAKRIYRTELPKTSAMKKEASLIASGDKKAIAKFTKLLQTVDKINRKIMRSLIEASSKVLSADITEAEYQGKKVELNKPFRGDDSKKKFYVYVKNDKDNIIKLGFGDPDMDIKRDDPARLKNFRARFQCDTDPGPKWKAKYWSCKFWEKGKTVTDLLK